MKKLMLAAILAVLVIAVFVAPVMAVKPDTVGKPVKEDKITGKPVDVIDADSDEVTAPSKGKPERAEKINQGKLIATTNKVRQEQFKLTHEQLKEMGYKGSMSDFATGFNEATNEMKWQIRERMQTEDAFTGEVVRNMMTRELAEIRESLIGTITVDDETLADDVTEAVEEAAGEEIPEEVIVAIEGEVEYMDEEFKAELLLTATVGTEEEQAALAEQLEDFVEGGDVVVDVDVDVIRAELDEEAPLQEAEAPVEEAAAEEPAVEEPVVEAAAVVEPAVEAPDAEAPAVEEPIAEEPVAEEPAAEEEPIALG